MDYEAKVATFRAFLATYSAGGPGDYSDWNEWDIFPEFEQILKNFDYTFGVGK